jgi:hypothetical protein
VAHALPHWLAYIVSLPFASLDASTFTNSRRMGFALQFVERQNEIAASGALNNSCTLTGNCAAWDTYANNNGIVVLDSGV